MRAASRLGRRFAWVCAWTLGASAIEVSTGCGSLPPVQRCGEIPEGGCPIGRGGTCDDVLCAALYDCLEGAWTEVERCERDPGTGGGGEGAGGEGGSAGGCLGFEVDRSDEAEGCEPELQEPDCSAAAAEVCRPCSTGCVDFWLCASEGWAPVGYCDETGGFVPERGR
jgi:hypothetical protein